jgi:hypothetical protein
MYSLLLKSITGIKRGGRVKAEKSRRRHLKHNESQSELSSLRNGKKVKTGFLNSKKDFNFETASE